jgi:hypothetical protein
MIFTFNLPDVGSDMLLYIVSVIASDIKNNKALQVYQKGCGYTLNNIAQNCSNNLGYGGSTMNGESQDNL